MFFLTFSFVFMMLVYMFFGFLLCKSRKAVVSHAKSMSALLLYVLNPAMLINSFLQLEYSRESLIGIGKYFITSFLLQLSFFVVLFLLLRRKYEDSRFRIMTIGSVLGNVGFLGLPLISSLFPNDPVVMVYSSINVMSMNLIVFTVGIYLITNDKKYISLKGAIWNPTSLSILAAFPLYLFGVRFPEGVMNAVGLLAKMVTPMCMIILGMRLSACRLKDIFSRPFVYATCVLKLIGFPVFAFLCVNWIPFLDPVMKATVVVLATMPSGAVIESLAEMHECEQEFAANVVLLTTILSVITIPVMLMILI